MKPVLQQIRRLAIFACVVEQGSFTAAARTLQMGRGRISEQIAELERALSVRLLQRSTRQMQLTPEGQAVYQHCRQLLPDAQLAMEAVEGSDGDPAGRLRISAPVEFCQAVLGPFLGAFHLRYPQIDLRLDLADQTQDLLQSGIDLALRIGLPKDSAMIGRVLSPIPLGLFASQDYLARHGVPETPQALAQHRLIGMDPLPQQQGHLVLHHVDGREYQLALPPGHSTDTPLGSSVLIEQGVGIGVGSVFKFHSGQLSERVVPVLPDWQHHSLQLSVLFPSRAQLPRRTRLFIDELVDWLQRGEGAARLSGQH
ncbi:LysR family transcriptional regulator [Ferrimonas pelagia]|uniref:LysR family transcriptional regulator n=1 Tax=Ferrimonas pelagia TaxID=1177826 RepID=A0ABP9EGR1_9GAMM